MQSYQTCQNGTGKEKEEETKLIYIIINYTNQYADRCVRGSGAHKLDIRYIEIYGDYLNCKFLDWERLNHTKRDVKRLKEGEKKMEKLIKLATRLEADYEWRTS